MTWVDVNNPMNRTISYFNSIIQFLFKYETNLYDNENKGRNVRFIENLPWIRKEYK